MIPFHRRFLDRVEIGEHVNTRVFLGQSKRRSAIATKADRRFRSVTCGGNFRHSAARALKPTERLSIAGQPADAHYGFDGSASARALPRTIYCGSLRMHDNYER